MGSAATALRGAFINTEPAKCSIFESGKMVYGCLKDSSLFFLDYITLDEIDLAGLAAGSPFRLKSDFRHRLPAVDNYDFWVLNFHHVTMAPHFSSDWVRGLPGLKFAIVLEVEPNDPLKFVMSEHFDNHIVLDPSAARSDRVTPFPRPLRGESRAGQLRQREIPVIGSYGLGTPGKGFEHLVQAVNQEFDRAIIRINVASATYAHEGLANIHRQPYADYLEELCRRVAKPGIEIEFSTLFMGDDELIDWCGDNDLNSFFYSRRQSGLSAATDQCILSGQPLIVSTNDTFRHIHRYIPPYPLLSIRKALAESQPHVKRMQVDWCALQFREVFDDMLVRMRRPPEKAERTSVQGEDNFFPQRQSGAVIVVVDRGTRLGDAFWYPQRAIDALGRTGRFQIVTVLNDRPQQTKEVIFWANPSAVLLIGSAENLIETVANYAGPVIHLRDSYQPGEQTGPSAERQGNRRRVHFLERRPIVPYFTAFPFRPPGPVRIGMIGFLSLAMSFQHTLAKIQREYHEGIIQVLAIQPADDADRELFEATSYAMRRQLLLTPGVVLNWVEMPSNAERVINWLGVNDLNIFACDPDRIDQTLDLCDLALATERATVFTRSAPFPHLEQGIYVEDHPISSLINRTSSCQTKLYNQFTEGRFYRDFCRLVEKARLSPNPPLNGCDAAFPAYDPSLTVPAANGILEGSMPQWLERRYQRRLPSKEQNEYRKREPMHAGYYRQQQSFLLTAVERLCLWNTSKRILCLGDSARSSLEDLRRLGYWVESVGDHTYANGEYDCVFSTTALPDIGEAGKALAAVVRLLRTNGGGAFTFFTREAYATADERENLHFPVLDRHGLELLARELGLSLLGRPNWQVAHSMLEPNPYGAPPLATLTFVKAGLPPGDVT